MNTKSLRKQLFAAIAMVMVAVIAISSSTFAWFSMNTQVNATGMNIKAKAEGGIIISNEAKLAWSANATASHQTTTEVIPTSTANCTAWYHAVSDEFDNAKANQNAEDYVNCTTTASVAVDSDGVGIWTDSDNNDQNIYLLNKFYIKSSADAITAEGTKLYINQVTVTGNSSSPELDKAMRVAIVIDGTAYIYAGFDGATLSYTVAAGSSATTARAYNTKNVATTVTSIPANNTSTPIEASIYLYFEGEDANCKSSNIKASLDALNVAVQFGTTAIPTT